MTNCTDIIFGKAVIEINSEYMEMQEKTNKIKITDYGIVNVCFFPLSLCFSMHFFFHHKCNFFSSRIIVSDCVRPLVFLTRKMFLSQLFISFAVVCQ